MANQFSEEQRKHILLAFNQLDKDGDGKLSIEEVTELIKEMGCVPTREEIDKLISECDADKSGTIEAGEFLALMASMMLTITSEDHIRQSFQVLKDPKLEDITFDSLKQVLNKMGEAKVSDDDIRNMIQEADLQNRGTISFEEFKTLLKR